MVDFFIVVEWECKKTRQLRLRMEQEEKEYQEAIQDSSEDESTTAAEERQFKTSDSEKRKADRRNSVCQLQ